MPEKIITVLLSPVKIPCQVIYKNKLTSNSTIISTRIDLHKTIISIQLKRNFNILKKKEKLTKPQTKHAIKFAKQLNRKLNY